MHHDTFWRRYDVSGPDESLKSQVGIGSLTKIPAVYEIWYLIIRIKFLINESSSRISQLTNSMLRKTQKQLQLSQTTHSCNLIGSFMLDYNAKLEKLNTSFFSFVFGSNENLIIYFLDLLNFNIYNFMISLTLCEMNSVSPILYYNPI